jgi:hypothetical protein
MIIGESRCKTCSHIKPSGCFYARLGRRGFRIDTSCKECRRKLVGLWRAKNRERLLRELRDKRRSAPERSRLAVRKWAMKNQERINRARRDRFRKSPYLRFRKNAASRIHMALKFGKGVKSEKTVSLLGCSLPELRVHIEKQFQAGMTWENYGPVWHIDHKRPCASFDLSCLDQQKFCFHFTNLQPLFAKENLRKGKSMPKNNPSTSVPDTTSVAPVTEVHPNPAPSSPWNYSIDEDAEREKAMKRADEKIPNVPYRGGL